MKDPTYRQFILHLTCLLQGRTETRCFGVVEGHHVKECPGALKNDRRMVPLCSAHHRIGPDAVEKLGRKNWEAKFGIGLEWWIAVFNEKYGRTSPPKEIPSRTETIR